MDRAERVAGIDIREREVTSRKRPDGIAVEVHRSAGGGGSIVDRYHIERHRCAGAPEAARIHDLNAHRRVRGAVPIQRRLIGQVADVGRQNC